MLVTQVVKLMRKHGLMASEGSRRRGGDGGGGGVASQAARNALDPLLAPPRVGRVPEPNPEHVLGCLAAMQAAKDAGAFCSV
jgi:hypothetical protein